MFSQEVAHLHGFPPESTHPIQNLPSETPVGDLVKQQKIRAELIKEIEKEINRDKRRGRPARKKYPENSLGLPADFLDAVPGPSGIQCLTSKRKTMKHPPQYAFDYDEWQALLNLQVYEMNDIANDVNPQLILEDQVEEDEIDVHEELERDITDQIENNPLVYENNTETDAEHEPSPATTAAEDMYSGVSEHDTTDTNVDDESDSDTASSVDSDRDNFEVSGGDDEELIDFELIQNKQPSRGQKLLYYCKRRDSWQIITLTSNVNKH